MRARKSEEDIGRRGLTICYWKPSVLFFDFELVCQSRGVWVLRIVHLRIWVVRRLYTLFNVCFLWRGCRHDVFGYLQVSDGGFSKIPWLPRWPSELSYTSLQALDLAEYAGASILEAEAFLFSADAIQIWEQPVGRRTNAGCSFTPVFWGSYSKSEVRIVVGVEGFTARDAGRLVNLCTTASAIRDRQWEGQG